MILLTGGSGYLGGHLAAALRAKGEEVKLLRHGSDFAVTADGWRLDLAASDQLARLPQVQVNALVHCAGLIDIRLRPNPAGVNLPPVPGDAPIEPMFRANVLTTAALADFCKSRGIPFFLTSSQTVYGVPEQNPVTENAPQRPLEPYAASKAAAESVVRVAAKTGLNATTLRFPGIYGGSRRGGAVWSMAKSALLQHSIRVSVDLPLAFDVLHVDDVVSGIIAALAYREPGLQCYNLGSDEPCSLVLLANAIAALVPGCAVEPPPVAQPVVHLSIAAARRSLNWSPRPRAERLSGVIESVRRELANAA